AHGAPDAGPRVRGSGPGYERIDHRETDDHGNERQDQHHAPADQAAAEERAPIEAQGSVEPRVRRAALAGRTVGSIEGRHPLSSLSLRETVTPPGARNKGRTFGG